MRMIYALCLFLYLVPAMARPTVLRYLRCEEAYFLYTIDGTTTQLYPVGPAAYIDSLSSAYLRSIQRQMPERGLGLQLYRALLPEALRQTGKLVICADGPLGRLPFECLVTDTAGPAYLVQKAEILYSTNLQAYFRTERKTNPGNWRMLALAPNTEAPGLPALPYANQETAAGIAQFPGRHFHFQQVSKPDFLALAPRFDILHLATHARADPQHPGRSSFLLHRAGQTDTIYADELQQLQLRTQLLILSACNSANGLAPAFLEAGARNVLAAAWDIPDKCSSTIITSFYRHLRNGCDKARALQLAKVEFLTSADAIGAEPYCWAGLMLYGDAGPLTLRAASPQWTFVFDSLVCMTAAFLFYISKKYIPGRRSRYGL